MSRSQRRTDRVRDENLLVRLDADTGLLKLSRDDQVALWLALQNPPPPTEAQRALGKLIRSIR